MQGTTTQGTDIAQQVGSVIDTIAAKLAVPAAQLWEILTRQAVVDGIGSAVWALAWFVAATLVWRSWWARAKAHDARTIPKDQFDDDSFPVAPFVLIATTILVGFGLHQTTQSIAQLVNPQFAALKYVLDALK